METAIVSNLSQDCHVLMLRLMSRATFVKGGECVTGSKNEGGIKKSIPGISANP